MTAMLDLIERLTIAMEEIAKKPVVIPVPIDQQGWVMEKLEESYPGPRPWQIILTNTAPESHEQAPDDLRDL